MAGAGSRRCLVTDTETWTYNDLLTRSNQVAHVLVEELGVVPGNRVLLRGPNNPWLVAAWFGVLKAGGVAVTTMPLLRAGELQTVAEIAELKHAICDHRFVEDLEGAAIPRLVTLLYGKSAQNDLTTLAAAKPAGFENVATAADDVCLLAFTSGTTGKPKATMHFHRDVLAIADTFSRHVLRPMPDDLFTGSPPLAFTFGLGQSVVFPLHAGAATFLMEQPSPARLLEAVERHRITVLATAPTAYRAMLPNLGAAHIGRRRRGTRSMRRAGSPSSTASARRSCSTSSSRPPAKTSGQGAPDALCRATLPRSRIPKGVLCRTESWGDSR
jgi:2-aminobenzoate-CoA ligase